MAEDPRYRLGAVRDARTRDERGKRGQLAAAVTDAKLAEATLERARGRTRSARDAVVAAIAARDRLVAQGSTPARIALADRFIQRRRHELESLVGEELRAEAFVETQQSGVDVARRTLARARADRELIDRHFTRWREARRRLADRRED